MVKRDPIIVTGSGRSGTNWLLNLLDLHYETHCRNEPEDSPNTPMNNPSFRRHFGPLELDDTWDSAVDWAATHIGDRDRAPLLPKIYIHPWAMRLGLEKIYYKIGARNLLCYFDPTKGKSDWELPWWIGSKNKLRQAIPVLKLPSTHRLVMWVLENRPNTQVVHMVRHPGGTMSSWKSRYLEQNDEEKVLAANLARLHEVVKQSPEWGPVFGNIDNMEVMEAEAWYWSYATSMLHRFGEGRSNYYSLTYEALVGDQIENLKRVYQAVGLGWSDDIEQYISQSRSADNRRDWTGKVGASRAVAESWQRKLSDKETGFIQRALAASACADWWDD